jgi:hypothetical protein
VPPPKECPRQLAGRLSLGFVSPPIVRRLPFMPWADDRLVTLPLLLIPDQAAGSSRSGVMPLAARL